VCGLDICKVLQNFKIIYGYKLYFESLLLLFVGSASTPCLGRQVDHSGCLFNWDSECVQASCYALFYLLYWNECYRYRIISVRGALNNIVFINMNNSNF
jgi:hypothetical protein